MIKTLVLTGEGINSHQETAVAFERAGSSVDLVHMSDFLELDISDYDILAFPGGFSFGDEIRSGKLMAQEIRVKKLAAIKNFIAAKKPVIGICNGFQILVQLGLFEDGKRTITLRKNAHNKFINRWVSLRTSPHVSFWTEGIKELYLPVRHGEGRLYGEKESLLCPAFFYESDINGSVEQIAGLFNPQGNVLGLMPHPECALDPELFPDFSEMAEKNQKLFDNAVKYSERMKNA